MAEPEERRPTFAGRLRVDRFRYRGDADQVGVKREAEEAAAAIKVEAEAAPEAGRRLRKRKAVTEAAEEEQVSPFFVPNKSRRVPAAATAAAPTYAHLRLLPDALGPHPLVLFVGLNPGIETARSGHAYAHPTNLFWRLLASSGITPVACAPAEDSTLPARFRLSLTNIVARPSRNGAELRAAELDAGVAVLEAKARRWRPEVVCVVGKGIWDSIVRVRKKEREAVRVRKEREAVRARKKEREAVGGGAFHYGWQDVSQNMGCLGPCHDPDDVAEGVRADPDWQGARMFVATSTSGLAASLSRAEKEAVWRQLGEHVARRRQELEAEGIYLNK